MSRKVKFDKEMKIKVVMEYINGLGSLRQLAQNHGFDESTLRQWVARYKVFGDSVFNETHTNKSYSPDFKQMVSIEYLNGGISYLQLSLKYKITDRSQVMSWVKMYNNHKELNSYKLGGGMIMRKGRKTTYDERIEIVEYCLKNGLDYVSAANEYEVSYQQIYSWVSKYNDKGIIALKDNRGRGKSIEDMDEVEKLKAENKLLKAKIERFQIEEELKKKLQEVEIRLVSTTRKKK
ncbi:MAG: helix-turn-helix domain-containing protein [Tissierellia bacterium]|nr:helix-turn-helix domain-containing protein [Tissierellia bacterium]